MSIDDVHPGRSTDPYEAGGDLGNGALRHLEWLLERHRRLEVTLFVTPDWRETAAFPTRRMLARIPILRNRYYLAPVHTKGTMSITHHPEFVSYLGGLPRTDVALHGLHHVHRGPRIPVEFQDQDAETCELMLREALALFRDAGLDVTRGMAPPGWEASPALLEAMDRLDFAYVASARDIVTDISPSAKTAMSGLRGVPLIRPVRLGENGLVHIPVNFQATNRFDRAVAVLEAGGLLSIKAHIVKAALGHVALDGLDELYCNYLDLLFAELENRYGDTVWWTTMGEIADRVRRSNANTG